MDMLIMKMKDRVRAAKEIQEEQMQAIGNKIVAHTWLYNTEGDRKNDEPHF